MKLDTIGKTAASALGAVAQVLAAVQLPPRWQPWGAVIIALATALGVAKAPPPKRRRRAHRKEANDGNTAKNSRPSGKKTRTPKAKKRGAGKQ